MIAVVKTGGKQYKVREGETLHIEKVAAEVGEPLALEVLLVAGEEGENARIGNPVVSGATVMARVLEHGLGEKIHVVKYKPKVRYRRNVGHRQMYTKVKIEKIA